MKASQIEDLAHEYHGDEYKFVLRQILEDMTYEYSWLPGVTLSYACQTKDLELVKRVKKYNNG